LRKKETRGEGKGRDLPIEKTNHNPSKEMGEGMEKGEELSKIPLDQSLRSSFGPTQKGEEGDSRYNFFKGISNFRK